MHAAGATSSTIQKYTANKMSLLLLLLLLLPELLNPGSTAAGLVVTFHTCSSEVSPGTIA
jgi:hypothetical protein